MAEELGEININVDEDSAEDASESLGFDGGSGSGSEGGGGGTVGDAMGGMTDMLGGMTGMIGGILGVVSLIAGVILGVEAIQQILSGIMDVISAFIAPMATMLLQLFQPVLTFMLKLLPVWMSFIDNFKSLISEPFMFLLGPLLGMVGLLAALKTIFPEKFKEVKDAVVGTLEWLWEQMKSGVNFITSLPSKIASSLKGLFPGTGGSGGAVSSAVETAAVSAVPGGPALNSIRKSLDINVSGYNDEQIIQTLGRVFGIRGE